MDAYPLRPGHVLITPRRHAVRIAELSDTDRRNLFETAAQVATAMRRIHPEGTDLHWLLNDGKTAFQHVPHVHLHLIPRRPGDGLKLLGGLGMRVLGQFGRRDDMQALQQQANRITDAL